MSGNQIGTTDATVIIGPWDTKVVPIVPRSTFGQRKTPVLGDLPGALNAALGIAGETDRAQQENFKRIARDLREAGGAGAHVCPSLILSIANRITGLANAAEALAAEAKSLGLLKAPVSLREHAGLLESLAAEIEAEQSV